MYNKKKIIYIFIFIFLSTRIPAYALPEVAQLIAGEATIEQTQNQLSINAADNTILHFNSFNIASQESVNIQLPNSHSQILNRVMGNDPSQILGKLSSNGLVLLVNPHGIFLGSSSNINSQSVILSTRDIDNQDFLNRQYSFNKTNLDSMDRMIQNNGTIVVAQNGFAALVAGGIDNPGVISAPIGTVALAGGDAVKLEVAHNGLVSIAIEKEAASMVYDYEGNPITNQIKNSGRIEAGSGRIIMNARGITDAFSKTINTSGIVNAATEVEITADGEIVLKGSQDVAVSGTMLATSTTVESEKNIVIDEPLNTTGSTLLAANENIEVNADVVTTSGNLTFKADHDFDGEGSFLQAEDTIIATRNTGNISIQASGQSTLANIDSAGDLALSKAGADVTYTQHANSQITTKGSLIINPGVLLEANNAIYSVAKNWENYGNFNPQDSTVKLTVADDALVMGSNIFNNFEVIAPGKTVTFEAGELLKIIGVLTLAGGFGKLLLLRSSSPSIPWKIEPTGSYDIQFVLVDNALNINIHGPPLKAHHSDSFGNTVGWDVDPIWTGAGQDNYFSTSNNWDTGTVPISTSIITFNGDVLTYPQANKDAVVDSAFQGVVADFIVSGYLGTITLERDLTVTGNFTQSSGTVILSSTVIPAEAGIKNVGSPIEAFGDDMYGITLTIGGDFSYIGGQFEANGGTLALISNNDIIFDSDLDIDGHVLFDTTGFIQITDNASIISDTLTMYADGPITSSGIIKTGVFTEQAAALSLGGTVEVGQAYYDNLDNAVTLNTGNYSGTTDDNGDIIINNNAVITLTGDTVFEADANTNGNGQFTMNAGSSIVGGGFNLTIYSSESGDLRTISGVATLSLNESDGGSNPTYTANNAISVTNFTIPTGVYNANGQTTTVSTLLTVNGGTYQASTATQTLGGLTVSSGTFTGSTGRVDVNGDFTVSNGTFTAPSGVLSVSGAFTHSGGTFTHNSGTVVLDNTSSKTFTISGTTSFNNLYINDGLIGYWKLNGDLTDSAGYSNTATANDGAASSATVPTLNYTNSNSYNFDGSDDDITLPHVLDPNDGPFTFSIWLNADTIVDSGTSDSVIHQANGTGTGRTPLYISAGGVLTSAMGGGALVGGTTITTGQWYHVAITVSGGGAGSTQTMYLNGISIGSNTIDPEATDGNHILGQHKSPDANAQNFDGKLDDFRIYNRALSVQEIQAMAVGNQPGTSAATTTISGGTLDVNGNLVLNTGTLATGNNNITLTGNWENNGGVFTPGTGTVTFDGTASGKTLLSGGQSFYNTTFSGNGGAWTLQDRLDVDNILTISHASATLDVGSGYNYTIHSGVWTQTAGTFTARSGTVVLDKVTDSTFTPSSSFNILRIEDPTENGLVGYWKFDEDNGTITYDKSGSGNNGTLTNTPFRSETVTGTIGFDNPYSLDFDGSDDYLTMGDPTTVDFGTGDFTFAAWIYNDTQTSRDVIIAKDGDGGQRQFDLILNSNKSGTLSAGKLTLGIISGGGGTFRDADSNAGVVSSGAWHHIVGLRRGTSLELWLDGSQLAIGAGTAPSAVEGMQATTANLTVGRRDLTGFNDPFDGKIDDVRIYNRALTQQEITNLAAGRYAAGNSSTATQTLGANLTTATLAIDSGILNASTYNSTITNAVTLANGNGNLTTGSGTMTLTGGLTVSGATFTGGSGRVDVNGDFTVSSGTFTAPSGVFSVSGAFTHSGGTFTHNSGTVVLDNTSSKTLTLSGGTTFNNLYINDGLIGYWKLNGNTNDSSGYGVTGTANGDAASSGTVPTLNYTNSNSYVFDGTGDFVSLGNPDSLQSSTFTVSAWIYATNLGGNVYRPIIADYDTTGSFNNYHINIIRSGLADGGKLYTSVVDNSSTSAVAIDSTTALSENQWYHVTSTYDGSVLRLYKDGTQVASTNIAITPSNLGGNITIGREGDYTGASHFTGNIDDVRIYNRALSAQEIQAMAVGNQPGASVATTTLEDTLDVNGNLIINSGTLDTKNAENNAITVAGNWENNGGKFTPRSGTVTFDGTAAGKTLLSGGQSFNSTTFSGNGGAWTLQDRLDVDGTLSITHANATLDVSTSNYTIHSGVWTQTAGTFTPRSGTVVLDSVSNATFTPSSSFNILRIEDPTEDGLVGYWKFDEDNGTISYDKSGNGNNGTLTNTPFRSESVTGTIGFDDPYSLDLDGTNDYVDLGTATTALSRGTITAWVKFDSVTTAGANAPRSWFSVGSTDGGELYTFNLRLDSAGGTGPTPGDAYVSVRALDNDGSVNNYVRGGTVITTGQWYHVAITGDASYEIYLNGNAETLTTSVGANNGAWIGDLTPPGGGSLKATIGTVFFQNAAFGLLDGQVDDVRVYDRVLTPTEIANLAAGRYADGDNSTATHTLAANLDVNDSLILDSGVLDTANGSNFAINVGGPWLNYAGANAFIPRSGTVTFDGTSGTKDILSNGGIFNNLVFNDGGGTATFELEDALDVNGTLTITGGTLDTKAGENNSINVAGTWTNADTFTSRSGTVTFDGTSGTIDIVSGGSAFNNLVFNDGGGTATFEIEDALDVDNDLTITGGTLDTKSGENNSIAVGGQWLNSDAFTARAGTVTMNATSGTKDILSNSSAFYNLTFNDGGGTATFELEDALDVDNDLTITGGTLDTKSGENNSVAVGGQWLNSDIFTARNGTVTLNATSGTKDILSNGSAFYNLTLNDGGGTTTFELEDALDVDNDITITGGTLDTKSGESNSIAVGGQWLNSDTFTARSGTVTLNATSGTKDILSNGSAFYNLTLNDGGGTTTFEIEDTLDVDNNLTITGGTLDTKSGENNTIFVGGNWDNDDTFTAQNGTVVFNATSGTKTIDPGSSVFYNVIFNDGLVGYWKLNGNLTDASGYANTGTANGGVASSATVPSLNYTNSNSYSFNGSSEYITTSFNVNSVISSAFTVNVWAYPTNLSPAGFGLIVGENDATNSDWRIYAQAGSIFGAAGSGGLATFPSAQINQWQMFTMVYDGANVTVYTNGTNPVSDGTGALDNLVSGMSIGARSHGASYFPGLIDDVRIYNRALTTQEIQALAVGNQPATGSAMYQLSNNALNVDGDLLINSGTLNANNLNINVAGNWNNNGGIFTPGTSTVTFDGTAAGKEILSGGQSFATLAVNGAGGAWTLQDRLDVNTLVDIDLGTLDVSTNNYVIHAANWDQDGGTFTARSGTVVLDGSSNVTFDPSDPFYILRIEDPTESGLVGYWKFDEQNGTTAYDLSGNANNGTLTNTPARSESVGTTSFDNPFALDFDGTNDYVTVGTSLVNFNSDFSVSTWVNVDDLIQNTYVIMGASQNGDITKSYWLLIYRQDQGGVTWQYDLGTGGALFPTAPSMNLTANTWQHVTLVRDRTNGDLQMYLNGTAIINDSTNPTFQNPTGSEFVIGSWENTPAANFFKGNIDDVRIYNRALTQAEVTALASGGYADGDNSTATYTLAANLDVNNNFAIDAGKLDTASGSNFSINAGESFLNYSGSTALVVNTSTVTLDAASGTVDILSGGESFYNLIFNDGGGTTTFELEDALDVDNDLTITGGTLDTKSGENNSIAVGGQWLNSDTFTARSGTVTLNATSGTKDILSNGSAFYNLTLNDGGGTTTFEIEDAFDVDNDLTITGGTLDTKSGENNSVAVGGQWLNSDTFTARSGTVTLNAISGTKDILSNGSAFYNLTLNDGGGTTTFEIEDAFDVDNDLTITGGTLDTKSGENNSIAVGGQWLNSDIFTARSGTVTLNATSGTKDILSNGSAFYNLILNDGGGTAVFEIEDAFDVDNDLTITGGTLDTKSGENNSIAVGGQWLNSDIFTARSGTVTLNATSGTKDILSNGSAFYNLTLNDGGGTTTFELEDALDVDNDLTITGGTLDTKSGENNSVAVGGQWLNSDTFTARSGTVTLNATSGTKDILSNGSAFYNLTLNDGGGTAVFEIEDAFDVDNDLTITGGTLDTKSGENNSVAVGGQWLNSDTFTARSGTVTLNATSGTKDILSNGSAFYNLTLNDGGGTTTFEIEDAFDVDNDLTITGGTLDTKSGENNSIAVGGQWLNSDIFTARNGTVTLNATSGTKDILSNGSAFYNLTLNDGGGTTTFELEDALDVDNDLTITGGTLDTKSGENNSVALGRNWTNSDIFTARSGTVTLNGANGVSQTLDGTTTFYNLAKTVTGTSSLILDDADIFTITNDISLSGAAGQLLTLTSDHASNTVDFDLQAGGSQSLAFLNVIRIDSESGQEMVAATSTNGGGNINWRFAAAATLTWVGGTSTNFSTPSNWDLAITPGANDTAVIADVASDPILSSSTTLSDLIINASGILSLAGNNLTVNDAFSNSGTLRLQGGETISIDQDTDSGTWEYVGDNDAALDTYTIKDFGAGADYYNLVINPTDGLDTFQLAAALDIENDLTISQGVLSAGSNDINIAGDWDNDASFDAGTSTVTFDGDEQTITGDNTFYNLTKDNGGTLNLGAGETQTILGMLTLKGADGNNSLTIQSTAASTNWILDLQGESEVQFIEITDSNNIGTPISCTSGCTNFGNNIGWTFDTGVDKIIAQASYGLEDLFFDYQKSMSQVFGFFIFGYSFEESEEGLSFWINKVTQRRKGFNLFSDWLFKQEAFEEDEESDSNDKKEENKQKKQKKRKGRALS